jgi:hypothetical protein
MKQKTTAFCVAAAFGCIATLGAQTPTSTTSSQSNTMRSTPAHDVTVTGCLAKGADGRFVLNNAKMDDQMSSSTAAGTTAGTTAGTPASKTNMPAATTWMLGGGSDLDKHLGHKIQVTGKTSWDGSTPPGATAGGTSTTGTPTTAGTTGSATTSGEQRTTSESDSKAANQPRLDVQSIKMIAASCS